VWKAKSATRLLLFFSEPGSIPGFGTHLFFREKWKKKWNFHTKDAKGRKNKKKMAAQFFEQVAN